jgi:short-subunit dehydrogenase
MSSYALITGASSGIGRALAEALARRGRALILVARQREALESIACELTQRFGVEVLFLTCNLAEPLQISGLLHELERGEHRIDLLVNAAGLGSHGLFIDQHWSREQHLLEVNVLAVARLCHALGYHMAEQGGGQILNIASMAAFRPGAGMSNYHASKAYVLSLSESLRLELKPRGVKVSVLCPSPTRSAFLRNAGIHAEHNPKQAWLDPEELALFTLQQLAKNRPLIIPGWRNRLQLASLRLLPRGLVRWLSARHNRKVFGS